MISSVCLEHLNTGVSDFEGSLQIRLQNFSFCQLLLPAPPYPRILGFLCCCSVTQLGQILCDPWIAHQASCPLPSTGACSNSCPSSRWCHPTVSSSVVPFSSRLQSFPASGSFPMSQLFASGGQSIGASASASALPVHTQGWLPLGWTGWISLVFLKEGADFFM